MDNPEQPIEETVVPAPEVVEEAPAPETELVDHVITQEDLDANPSLATEGVKIGDVIQLPMSEESLTDEQKAEIEKQHPGSFPDFAEAVQPAPASVEVLADGAVNQQESLEAVAETTPDSTLVYKGKTVISTGTETVNGITYQRVVLEDATTVLLTEEEYRKEVNVN